MKMKTDDLKKEFIRIYGRSENAMRVFFAPGRVNLIGEHTDYNGGYVFPAALTMTSTVIVRRRSDRKMLLRATTIDDAIEADMDRLADYRTIRWGNYQLGVADELQKAGVVLSGCEMLFDIDIPIASGLSSSAAIEVSTAIALICECLLTYESGVKPETKDLDMMKVAELCQKAENNFVGVKCGILDQFASSHGRSGNAILLNCNTMKYQYIPFSTEEYKIVISNTNVKRSLAVTKYNERRAECEAGLRILQTALPEKTCLGEVTASEFDKYKNLIADATIRKRVRHVVTEDDRVRKSAKALKKGDILTFGKLMSESHRSLKNEYEVTGDELDVMTSEAMRIPGTAGSRMTGAGFGGCAVSIVKSSAVELFIDEVGKKYYERIGLRADFYISDIGDGAGEMKGDA
jgi:galactokinase